LSYWEWGVLFAGGLFTGALIGPSLAILVYDWWQNR